jgi:hypothetical protein
MRGFSRLLEIHQELKPLALDPAKVGCQTNIELRSNHTFFHAKKGMVISGQFEMKVPQKLSSSIIS